MRGSVYGLTVFAGAFLLFELQPIMGKYLLPWFGGGPGVWAACLFFFQVFLLGGYAYAHLLTRYFSPRVQAVVHLVLLAAALARLPIVPAPPAKVAGSVNPWLDILLVLATTVGLPYLVLSTTGPLVQYWHSLAYPRGSAYRLYALSNAGSLLALISYPVLIEAHLTRPEQARVWGWGLVFYAICCAICLLKTWSATTVAVAEEQVGLTSGPSWYSAHATIWRRLLWILWPACASVLLLATTNKLCLDVASFPLLWILPLSCYLLSFVICFDHPRWYSPLPYLLGPAVILPCVCWALFSGATWPFARQVLVYCGGLLVCCLVCHGELYRLRPGPRQLTEFYLLVATGGALGGLFVSLIAPAIFTSYCELNYGLACFGLLLATTHTFPHLRKRIGRESSSQEPREKNTAGRNTVDWQIAGVMLLWLGFLALTSAVWLQGRRSNPDIVHRARNFYGVLTVFEHRKDEPLGRHYLLQHGRITHGLQLADPQLQMLPTTYYGNESGLGLALRALPAGQRKIGVVGLGTGTIAAYARPGDHLRFYEINPAVRAIAAMPFQYLAKCAGECEVTLGDARLALEQQPPQAFDLLVLDAFSSDAIPTHLMTREALETYLRHVKTNGIIAVHISNHFLELEPVVLDLAQACGLKAAVIDHDADPQQWWIYSSTWVLLGRDANFFALPSIATAAKPKRSSRKVRLWTDDFCSLLQILR